MASGCLGKTYALMLCITMYYAKKCSTSTYQNCPPRDPAGARAGKIGHAKGSLILGKYGLFIKDLIFCCWFYLKSLESLI